MRLSHYLLQELYDVSNVDVKLKLKRVFPLLKRHKIKGSFDEDKSIHCNNTLLITRTNNPESAIEYRLKMNEKFMKVLKFNHVIVTEIFGSSNTQLCFTPY